MKMPEFSKFPTSTWVFILLILILLIFVLSVAYWFQENPKLIAFVGGAISGLIVYLISHIKDIVIFKKLSKFKRMGIRSILDNREDKSYYGQVVSKATETVKVMGATCSRFITDFMDSESDNHILLKQLNINENLTVQLLIPNQENMSNAAKQKFCLANDKITRAKRTYGDRISIRKFPYKASHSIVIIDDDLIAGPIFTDEGSKNAPAVHVKTQTSFGNKYITYFNRIWEESVPVEDNENSDLS